MDSWVMVASKPVDLSVPRALVNASAGDSCAAVVVGVEPGELVEGVVQAATPKLTAVRIPRPAVRLFFTEDSSNGWAAPYRDPGAARPNTLANTGPSRRTRQITERPPSPTRLAQIIAIRLGPDASSNRIC